MFIATVISHPRSSTGANCGRCRSCGASGQSQIPSYRQVAPAELRAENKAPTRFSDWRNLWSAETSLSFGHHPHFADLPEVDVIVRQFAFTIRSRPVVPTFPRSCLFFQMSGVYSNPTVVAFDFQQVVQARNRFRALSDWRAELQAECSSAKLTA